MNWINKIGLISFVVPITTAFGFLFYGIWLLDPRILLYVFLGAMWFSISMYLLTKDTP